MPAERLGEIARVAMAGDPTIIAAAIADLIAVRTRDPAAESYLKPFLYYKGFHALQWHRIGHWLWRDGRRELAYFLQSRVSEVFPIDIIPPCLSGAACLSTTAPVSSLARLPSSATTFQSCMR
jgi:serine O-acetyltransferase